MTGSSSSFPPGPPSDEFLRELLEADENPDVVAADLQRLAGEALAPSGLRDRLMRTTTLEHRFDDLVAAVALESDLDERATSVLLRAIDDASRWEPGLHPTMELLHFVGGPARQRHITGFVRIAPGAGFPPHDHLGDEAMLVLQGEFRDSVSGEVHGRGALIRSEPGCEHALEVTSSIPLVYLAVVAEGIRLGDEEIRFDDPRA